MSEDSHLGTQRGIRPRVLPPTTPRQQHRSDDAHLRAAWCEYLSALLATAELAAARDDVELTTHAKASLLWFLDATPALAADLDRVANLVLADLDSAPSAEAVSRIRRRRVAVAEWIVS